MLSPSLEINDASSLSCTGCALVVIRTFQNYVKKKTRKHYTNISKKLRFSQTYKGFDGCLGNLKIDEQTIDLLKFFQRMSE